MSRQSLTTASSAMACVGSDSSGRVYIGQIVQRFAAYMIGPGLPFPELFLVLFVRTVVPSDDYGKYAGKEDKGCKNK